MRVSRKTIGAVALATALIAVPSGAFAAECPEGYPDKPIKFVIGYGAGGGTDAIARAVAAAVEQQQGWTVVPDNKPGAGGGVMAAGLMQAKPDGYTVGTSSLGTVALNPYSSDDTPFTYEDFDYLGSGMETFYGLVALADKPYSTFEEFIEFAKEKGRATVSVAGFAQEFIIDRINKEYGTELVILRGKGSADALQQALGDHVDATIQGAKHVQQIKAGKMKQLASLIDHRVDYAPDSKTLIESGMDATIVSHTIFLLPKGAPADIQACLTQAIAEAIDSDGYGELMTRLENVALNLGPEGTREAVAKGAALYKEALGK